MDHIKLAEGYAQQLNVETLANEGRVPHADVRADQGEALRKVIYHSAAAIVDALWALSERS